MKPGDAFKIVYLIGLLTAMGIRTIYGLRYRRRGGEPAIRDGALARASMGLWGIGLILPIFAIFSRWLAFADYRLPLPLGWLGAFLYAGAVLLLWRSHADLEASFSPSVELLPDHQLVTEGVFSVIRHPMYAAHILWGLAQPLLIQNWVAGPLALVASLGVYSRVAREEAMMLAAFGQEYEQYCARTGRLFPRFSRTEEN